MSKKIPIQKIDGLFNQYLDDQTVTAAEYNGNITALKEAIEHNGAILNDVKIIADGKTPEGYITTEHLEDGAVTLDKLAPEVSTGLPYLNPAAFGDFLTQAFKNNHIAYDTGAVFNGSIVKGPFTAKKEIVYTGPVVTRESCFITLKNDATQYQNEIVTPQPHNDQCYLSDVAEAFKGRTITGFKASWSFEYTFNTAINITRRDIVFAIRSYVAASTQFVSAPGYGGWPKVADCQLTQLVFLDENNNQIRTDALNTDSAHAFYRTQHVELGLGEYDYGTECSSLKCNSSIITALNGVKKIKIYVNVTHDNVFIYGSRTLQDYAPKIVTPFALSADIETTDLSNVLIIELPIQNSVRKYNNYSLTLHSSTLTADTPIVITTPLALPKEASNVNKPYYKTLNIKSQTTLNNYTTLELECPIIISGVTTKDNTRGNSRVDTSPFFGSEVITELVPAGVRYYWLYCPETEDLLYSSNYTGLLNQLVEDGVADIQICNYDSGTDKIFKINTSALEVNVTGASLVCKIN